MNIETPDLEANRAALKSFFLSLAPNTNMKELNELVGQFKPDFFPKKELILRAGDFSDTVYFVVKGLVRIYYINEEKEITNWFIPENRMFAATYTILSGKKNYSNYETMEDTYVLKINYSELESFYRKYHSLEYLGRKLIEFYYSTFMEKTHDVLFLSAEERYHIFEKDHSDLLKRVPLRIVASYLGITQETLSRMRSKK